MKTLLLALATITAVFTAAPASAQDCMSQSQARRAYGSEVHLYYRVDDGQRCWYAKGAQRARSIARDITVVPNGSPLRDLVSVFVPPPRVDVEEPRPRLKKAKHTKTKYTKVAKRQRTRAVSQSTEEMKQMLCGDTCPNFRKMGNLRALNERRARELSDVLRIKGM
jgi:hypothetical protein